MRGETAEIERGVVVLVVEMRLVFVFVVDCQSITDQSQPAKSGLWLQRAAKIRRN